MDFSSNFSLGSYKEKKELPSLLIDHMQCIIRPKLKEARSAIDRAFKGLIDDDLLLLQGKLKVRPTSHRPKRPIMEHNIMYDRILAQTELKETKK
jgi:hypothetical protein